MRKPLGYGKRHFRCFAGTVIHIDDAELDLAEFGRMLQVISGFGMCIAFVDEEEVSEEPEIVVREPDNDKVP